MEAVRLRIEKLLAGLLCPSVEETGLSREAARAPHGEDQQQRPDACAPDVPEAPLQLHPPRGSIFNLS